MGDSSEPRFLRSNAIIEPLVDRFYAWLHIVAPVQAAMNLANVQVPLLESYLHSPKVHVAATNNPELRGGYFVGIEEERSMEVSALLDAIKRDRADMLTFAAAVAEAEELLRQTATGFDLTPLYPKLPSALNGLVELAYDTNNQPSMRYIEPLLYHSPLYDVRRQSVQLSLDTGVERPFILATPRMPSPDVLELPYAFDHPGLDELFKARTRGTTLGHLREALELDDSQAAKLDLLLAPQPSLAPDRHVERGGRIRYFGHACLVIQTPEAAIVTDPFISTDNRAGDRYTLDDLPDHIDLAVITHGHQDHIVLETLLQLRPRLDAVVVPRSSRATCATPRSRCTCATWASRSSRWTTSTRCRCPADDWWRRRSSASTATSTSARSRRTWSSWPVRRFSSARTPPASTRCSTGTSATSSARSTWRSSAWSATARR